MVKDLVDRRIEVGATGQVQTIPSRVAKGQALRLLISQTVEQWEGLGAGDGTARGGCGARIANTVGVRTVVRDPVSNAGRVAVDAIDDGERITTLVCHEAGKLPSSQECVGESFTRKIRLFINPGHGQDVPLIVVRTGIVAVDVVSVHVVTVHVVRRIVE